MKYSHPWGENHEAVLENADVLIMGIPFDGAVSNEKGAAEAPDCMRELSRILPPASEEGLLFPKLRVHDTGDVTVLTDWSQYFMEVENRAADLIRTGKFCLFLGGDHSVTIPLETAFAKVYEEDKIGIIHFDSHPDIISEYDGHQWSHACTQRRAVELPNVDPSGLTFIGLRSFMDEELVYFSDHPEIDIIKARDVYRKGIEAVITQVLEKYEGYQRIYVTIDIDVLDPAFAPGTGTPEAGGLSTRELLEIVRELVTNLPVQVVDIVEVSPPLDQSNITSWAALKLTYELFGITARKNQKEG